MFGLRFVAAAALSVALLSDAWAENPTGEGGDDLFLSGPVLDETLSASGDTFVAAKTASTKGRAGGDLHVVGFDVDVSTSVEQDLYAFGGSVSFTGKTVGDLTVAGFSVRTEAGSEIGQNARLLGSSVVVSGAIAGNVVAAGHDVILNAPIHGDARIVARSISFGPDAVVAGILTYSAADQISVPDTVAPPERVRFERYPTPEIWDDWGGVGKEMPVFPTFATLFFGFVVSLAFFVVLGAMVLSFLPVHLERLRQSMADAPGRSILSGILGLAMLFGLVPVTGLTIVGLPFVPIVILAIVVFWTLGYALGSYSVAMRLWTGLGGEPHPGNVTRLLIYAAAIVFVALLNFIPFFGWVVNYTLVLLGIGAMTKTVCSAISETSA